MKVHINSHYFQKKNLITLTNTHGSYDIYECSECGLVGKRYGLSDDVTCLKTYTRLKVCSNPPPPPKRPKKVVVTGSYVTKNFGLEINKIYDVVDATDKKFEDDVWVFSEKRGEPIRLLPDEYTVCE